MTYSEYIKSVKDKNIGFLGIGRSNMPLIRMLVKAGVSVTVRDGKEKGSFGDMENELLSLGVTVITGADYLKNLAVHDVIYKTPGIRGDKPEILEAVSLGTVLTSEMELFFELCPCKIFAVTGSDGKTTTTTLIYNILTQAGYNCHLGGNIGRPLIGDIENIKPTDFAVVELSSFQLFNMKKSADVAVITNISENHLDWHKDYEEYIEAKKNIFIHQETDDLVVLNEDNFYTREMKDDADGNIKTFSLETDADVCLKDGVIYSDGVEIMKASDIKIPGIHNVANYMAAIAATHFYVSPEDIVNVAKNFGGVPHRNELVRESGGVSYYNDSIASSPTRAIATLSSFKEKVILIAGGYDKNLNYEPLGPVISEKVKHLILVGATSDKIEAAAKNAGFYEIERTADFAEAVMLAKKAAKPGDKVILSPASASFDMFRDFEERGNIFKEIVNSL
ncbi:MAG: UDP-N-acetylmuramoyl-L-alanine--D-glutamate ligase [Clostridia bacterium]|nr:UDP-N-acetylmuramoyl-L-alanine--D-glutamate ligase [Clostridia bacterium]